MNNKVEYLTKADIKSYIDLIDDTFGYRSDEESVEKMISKNRILIVKDKDRVIAAATLEENFEYIKKQKYYHLSYLAVSKEYRRMGLANLIFSKIEELVRENSISYIELTSGNQRKAAHYFYQSKDFKIKDTTVFIKIY